MKKFLSVVLMAALSMAATAQSSQAPAFPGAEGFGRYTTTGGRGGKVYHVTTLEDNGKTSLQGSLRWANAQPGPRTIVFDVSGTIYLASALRIADNTTLAGQTAPGDGICLADYPVTLGRNNIIRFVRFRLGNRQVAHHEGDGLGAMDSQNIIVDHCSVSWSIDECLSVYGSKNFTVQWCIASQSLVNSGHQKGSHGYGGNWGGSGASYHHNLIAHHTSRTPRLGPRPGTQTDERMDMRNNVMYNYGKNGCYGGEGMKVNIVNNYYKPGPASATGDYGRRIAGIGIRTTEYTGHGTNPNGWDVMWHVWGKYYVDGNVNALYSDVTNDNWTYGMYNQIDNSKNDYTYTQKTKDTIRLSQPIEYGTVTTHTATKAYDVVLKYVGASLHRDKLDDMIISDTRSGIASCTGSGLSQGFINSQDDVKGSGWSAWPELKSIEAPADSDGDGMPDAWEKANGLDPTTPNDAQTYTLDSEKKWYTNLEVYINSLVEDIVKKGNADALSSVDEYYPACTKMAVEDMSGDTPVDVEPTVTYTLAASTNDASKNTQTTYAFNNGITITNEKNKSYSTGKEDGIKYSAGVQYTISIPEGYYVTSIDFSGYNNYADADSYISEVNGVEYGSTDYVFPQKDGSGNYTVVNRTVALPTPAKNHVTFTVQGKQVVLCITLHAGQGTTGIEQIVGSQPQDGRIYNLQGIEVKHPSKGIYLRNGKKYVVK